MKHAAKVVQDIKMMRSAVVLRDKERAERATLVAQEKLIQGAAACVLVSAVCHGCTPQEADSGHMCVCECALSYQLRSFKKLAVGICVCVSALFHTSCTPSKSWQWAYACV